MGATFEAHTVQGRFSVGFFTALDAYINWRDWRVPSG